MIQLGHRGLVPLRRRQRVAVAAISLLIGMTVLITPRPATAADDNPEVLEVQSKGFVQVRDNGQLWYYGWTGFTFTPFLVDSGGWEQTRLIATVSFNRFVEVKGDVLRTWRLNPIPDRAGYTVTLLDTTGPGWGTMRAITYVGDVRGDGGNEIIGITANGDLMLYLSRGNGYVWEERLDNGYEHARLIAGLGGPTGHFALVNNLGDLYECFLRPPGTKPDCVRRMSGWENVRLLGPGGTFPGNSDLGDSFVSVRYDGQLVQWYWSDYYNNYTPGYKDTNWFNARLIG